MDLSDEQATIKTLNGWGWLHTPIESDRFTVKEAPRDDVRRRVARIDSVADLWKASEVEIRQLCAYYAAFDTLRFGHALVESYRDGRVGTSRDISRAILAPWLPAFQAPDGQVFLVITLFNLEAATLGWLSNDERLCEDVQLGRELISHLARHIFSLRRPGQDELRKTEALLASVLHPDDIDAGRNDDLFESWERCGRSGARMSLGDLAHLKPYLATRYPKLNGWFRAFLDEFLQPVNHYGAYRLDEQRFKARVESVITDTTAAVFSSLALRISEALEGFQGAQVVGFLGESIVIESPAKSGEALKANLDEGLKALVQTRELPLAHSIEIANHL